MAGLSADEQRAIEVASRHSVEFRMRSDTDRVPPRDRSDSVEPGFRVQLSETGSPAEVVIEEMVAASESGLHQMSSPNFFGYVLGGSHPAGVAADMLVSAWGQHAGSSFETPAIAAMERAVCDWSLDLLGLPSDCGVGIVTGATVANTQGVIAARHTLLAKQKWDVESNGLFGAPEIPVLIGDAAHSAPFAALRYAGLGARRVTRVAADAEGRIDPAAFNNALKKCERPPLVILQAGQINSGAFDPFELLIPAVHDAGGWVHVDGAFGLWLAAVPELRDRLAGVELADSWAVDLHKWLNAPFDAALCIVRDRAPLVASMSAHGAYLPDPSDHWAPFDSTFELSRRARGVPSYAIMKHLGKSGVRELVLRHCRLAEYLADEIAKFPGLQVLNEVACNQIAIASEPGDRGDAKVKATLDIIQKRGRVYPSHGIWRGQQIIRVSIINYATQKEHIDLLIDELRAAWGKVQGQDEFS